MALFRPVIESIRNQSVKPDAWYLNLPQHYRSSEPYKIPAWLRELHEITFNTEIVEDWGPAMKLLPALKRESDPNTVIITIDDDVVFPTEALRTFIDSAMAERSTAFCTMGFSFTPETFNIQPVREHGMECDVLQGFSGCCYRRGHFTETELLQTLSDLPSRFRYNDDIILSNHIANHGIARKTIRFPEGELSFMPWSDDDPNALKSLPPGTHARYQKLREHLQSTGNWHLQTTCRVLR